MSNRQRGVVLTDLGQQRLATAIAAAQDDEKDGKRFTQAELSERARLSIKTIKKIRQGNQPTDEESVRSLFGAFELTLEAADFGQPALRSPAIAPQSTPLARRAPAKIDWGEKPDTALFFGRTEELETLSQWVMAEQCRIVTLLGMGGIGKTSLAAKLADQIYDQFDYVIWRSLREAPPLDEILVRLIQFLSDQQETEINLPARLGERLIRLLHYLREHRCLLVLDNLESILQAESTGQFREGYEGYGELIQHIGSTEHQSCLLLTSRECPRDLAPMAGDRLPVRLWSVAGIDPVAGREILQTKGLELDETNPQSHELIDRYSGNPQALHLVATAIQREFLGDVDDFLAEEGAAVEDVRSLLDQHLTRLAPLERSILFWLAINREPVGLDELMEDLLPPVTKREVRSALRGLSDRYLIETVGKQFTLQNVIMEFATDRFVEQVSTELQIQQFDLFHTHALIKATAKDYVCEAQIRLILEPIAEFIHNLNQQVIESLQTIRQDSKFQNGYAPGSLINLLRKLDLHSNYFDFSRFTIRSAYLSGIKLYSINLVNANFIKPTFIDAFGNITSLAFSPNRNVLAVGNNHGEVCFWDNTNGKLIKNLKTENHWISSIAFSSDNKTFAVANIAGRIDIWDVYSFRRLCSLRGHNGYSSSLAFSRNGKNLASGGHDKNLVIWDIESRQRICRFTGHTHRIGSIAFSPDRKLIASGSNDKTVRIWDIESKKCLHVFEGHSGEVRSVAFSSDGVVLASGSNDKTIRLWNISTSQCKHVFQNHVNTVYSVAFCPSGKTLASGSADTTVRLWDINTLQCIHSFTGHSDVVRAVAFSPDGQTLVSGGDDAKVRFWSLATYKCERSFQGYTRRIRSVSLSPNRSSLITGGDDTIIRFWDVDNYRCLHDFEEHTGLIHSVAFSPDGKLFASSGDDTTVRLWDVKSFKCIHSFKGHTGSVRSVAFSPDSKTLISASMDTTLMLWDINTLEHLHSFRDHTSVIRSVAFSPDGTKIVSGSDDATVRIWHLDTMQPTHVFEENTKFIRSVLLSPDGKTLIVGAGQTVSLWDTNTGRCTNRYDCLGFVLSVALNFAKGIIAVGSRDTTVKFWELGNEKCKWSLNGHTGPVNSVSFSVDGFILISGDDDGSVRLWDVQTRECFAVFQIPRPYEGTNITGVQGLTEAQRASMIALGAVDESVV